MPSRKKTRELVASPSAAGELIFADSEYSLVRHIITFVSDPKTYALFRVLSRSMKILIDPKFSTLACSVFTDLSVDNPFRKRLNSYQKKTLGRVQTGLVNPHSLLRCLFRKKCALCDGEYRGGINNGFGIPCHDDGKCAPEHKLRDREVNNYLIGKQEFPYLDRDHVIESIGVTNSRQGYSGGSYGRGQYEYTTVLRASVPGFVPDISHTGQPMTIKGYEQVYSNKVAEGKARLADEERRRQEKEEEAMDRKRKREEKKA
eukprot:CAMPEP_0182499746 /NCGR_PEP_ID=MMETSP1321-20130603/7931_1 /TAXON_ID=91990 /ORGANISM="Bolidomonas sp., Strain RCC1657" /LENGTH=259 /DNA_ID=CAMNT_0024703987 /DNA_START=153 /DNA_END=928 /DNA_ORIENTATION=+